MKILIQESKANPKESDEYKNKHYYHYTTLFEGEANTLQFRTFDTAIATPGFISQHSDGTVIVIYSYPSNIRIEKEDGIISTLWAYPAITEQELKELSEKNAKDKTAREENLANIVG